jgi:type IV secretory pathway VirB10-like protein
MLASPSAAARPKRRWRPSKSFWVVAALVLLLAIASAASSGFGGIIVMLGLVALITGLYALFTKRKTWVSLPPHRKSAGMMAGAGVVALFIGGGVVGATASPTAPDVNKSALVASQPASTTTATPTPTATNPVGTSCMTAAATSTYQGGALVCTKGVDDRLLWLPEAESKQVVKAAVDKKAAEEKAAVDKKAAEEKAAADKIAAEKQAAAEKLAAETAAADKAAADAAAAEAARRVPVGPAVPAVPAGPMVVHPGAFCSGGVGVTSTGKSMVCAPAKDGKMRWISG